MISIWTCVSFTHIYFYLVVGCLGTVLLRCWCFRFSYGCWRWFLVLAISYICVIWYLRQWFHGFDTLTLDFTSIYINDFGHMNFCVSSWITRGWLRVTSTCTLLSFNLDLSTVFDLRLWFLSWLHILTSGKPLSCTTADILSLVWFPWPPSWSCPLWTWSGTCYKLINSMFDTVKLGSDLIMCSTFMWLLHWVVLMSWVDLLPGYVNMRV